MKDVFFSIFNLSPLTSFLAPLICFVLIFGSIYLVRRIFSHA